MMLIFVMYLPQLIYFGLIMWVVLTIARFLMPRRQTRNRSQQSYHDQQNQQNQNKQTNNQTQNKDVIDVEYTEREVDE